MIQQPTLQKISSDAQADARFRLAEMGSQWPALWSHQGDDSVSPVALLLGFASYTAVVYSPVRELLREKAEVLGALQERRIRKLQDALVEERSGGLKDRETVLRSLFSLYKQELMSMSEVMERAGMNRWEFFTYLDGNPEYQQVNIDDFLERVKED